MNEDFFNAIKQGNLKEVKRILSSNPGLIQEKENHLSPVMIAVYNHEQEIVEYLVEQAVNLTIFEAAATGKANQIARHLARDPMLINTYSEDGFQPLGLACFFGHYETAEYLIKAGAAINSPSSNYLKAAPIQSAAAAGHTKIVMLLLDHKANPNVREQGGYTPLHAAAQNGDTQMIRVLLFNGADLNLASDDGKLAVDMAVSAGKKEAAALLKEGITRRFRSVKL